jgi:hypothetical protein
MEANQALANYEQRRSDAHDDFVALASLITRLEKDDGLSPAALAHLVKMSRAVLAKAGVA